MVGPGELNWVKGVRYKSGTGRGKSRGDLKSGTLIVFKGFLFLCIIMIAGGLLFGRQPSARSMILLILLVWASARFYYFVFYVLEKYVDPSLRYAGIINLLAVLVRCGRSRSGRETPDPADPARGEHVAETKTTSSPRQPGHIPPMKKVNLVEKLSQFSTHWDPKIVGALNGQHVKLVKFGGPFVWHKHESEDELFLVVKGKFRMEFRGETITLAEGEFLIVPRGIEHRPVAESEVHILLFEPESTVNTGSAGGERTVPRPKWL